MLKQLTKVSKLYKTDLRAIKNLMDLSTHTDGFKTKFYWNIIYDRQTSEFNDLLYSIDGNLAGYLALFTFKIDEAEISAVVHPKYRRQGIFKKLLAEAALELRQRRLPRALFICHQSATTIAHYLKSLGAQYLYSQVEMTAMHDPVQKELPTVELRLAGIDDVVTLAKIGAESFGSPFLEVLQRFIENMKDRNRKAWLVSVHGENIGKIHVRYEADKTAFIHDLCIMPKHRGQNYAMAMILQTMQLLKNEGYKVITLDVEYHNKGALKLYERCGFETTAAYDFWHVATAQLP